ncbi:MAG TPA: prepilin-type N-terminal cleavage/methylation domain-containing protein [Polyangiaceae bacterium]|jgi:prepilin-type N-terminal cleavage/methylation domain-containing protein
MNSAEITRSLGAKRCRGARAFTLIELMVAMMAGLIVAAGAFALAKQGSRFFQQEARVANAQFAATLGFDRLRSDIARAAYLSTPNIQRDPFRCGDLTVLPTGMKSLAALRLTRATPSAAQDTGNGLAPDRITLTGSYSSTESFPVRTVVTAGTGYQVFLQANTGAIARTNNGGADGGSIGQVFQAGRVLRILDSTGHTEFGRIDGYAINADGQMVISLHDQPAISFRTGGGNCGIEGLGVGMQANVVNFIRYEVRNLKASALARYAPLYAANATGPGDDNRLELIRVELDADGNEIADTLELVTEYAVDLRFGLTVVPSFRTPSDPDLTSFPIGDSRNYDYAFDVATNATTPGPERIRGVRARLVVRSREGDRSDNIAAPTAGNIYRYAITGDAGFARARTLTADIQLPNLTGVTW